MTIELFLNEASVPTGNIDIDEARRLFSSFVGTIRCLRKHAGEVIFNTDTAISNMSLGDKFTVAALRNQSECVEEGQYLKRIQDRRPFSRVISELNAPDPGRIEYKIPVTANHKAGDIFFGLGLSVSLSGVSVSFQTSNFWHSHRIELDRSWLEEDGTVTQTVVTASNACCCDDADLLSDGIKPAPGPGVKNGFELWERREEMFPGLNFIPRVRAQIEALLAGERVFHVVQRKLAEINRAALDWRKGNTEFPVFECHVRPESTSRIDEGLVDFKDSNGFVRTFSNHLDYGPAENRLHFLYDTDPNKHILIGHVGRKIGIG